MHKKHSVSQLNNMLSDVLCLAFEYMEVLAREIKKINLTEENMSKNNSRLQEVQKEIDAVPEEEYKKYNKLVDKYKKIQLEINQELDRAQMLSHVLTVINDVIHPAHETAMEMFPQSKGFIEYCMNNQKMAIEKKLINPQCNCHSCKSKAPIGK